jgi:hypothetical protein
MLRDDMSKKEPIYKDRDNTIDRLLKIDDIAADLSGVTKMELIFPDVADPVSSADSADVFDWSIGDGKLFLSLGHIGFLTAGQWYSPELIVYDANNPDGVNWGIIRFRVKG